MKSPSFRFVIFKYEYLLQSKPNPQPISMICSTRRKIHPMTPLTNEPSSTSPDLSLPDGPRPTCPILLEAKNVLDKAHNLRRALRHLARSTRRCLTCPENSSCPSIRYFDHAVDLAIEQITREWGLDQD